jgi:hypothetical protein
VFAVPDGSEAGPEIDSGGFTVSEAPRLTETELLSVTVHCTRNGLPVLVVGVPVIAPVAVLNVSPVGSPVTDHP